MEPVWEMDENDWSKTFDCNVKNIYLFVKYFTMLKETQVILLILVPYIVYVLLMKWRLCYKSPPYWINTHL